MDKGKQKRLARARARKIKYRTFDHLPVEILSIISLYLSDSDIPYFAVVCKQFSYALQFVNRKYQFVEECIYSSLSRVEIISDSYSKLEVWNKSIVYGNLDILLTLDERPFSSFDVYNALLHGHVHVAEYLSQRGIIHDCVPGTKCNHIREDFTLTTKQQLNILMTGNNKSLSWLQNYDKIRNSMHLMIKQKNIPAIKYLIANFDYESLIPYEYAFAAIDSNDIEVYSYFKTFMPYQSQIRYAIRNICHNIIRHILHRIDVEFLRETVRISRLLSEEKSLEFSIMHIFAVYDDLEGIKKALDVGLSMDLRHILIECGRRNSINVFKYVLSLWPHDINNLHEIVNGISSVNTEAAQFNCLSLFYQKEWKHKIDKSKLRETITYLNKRNTIDSSNILELIHNH